MATKRKTEQAARPRGVTEMTMEKHRFAGFAVRTQKLGYTFRQYVSSSQKAQGAGSEASRRSAALSQAIERRESIADILADKRSWRGESLTKAAVKNITDLGFTMEYPVGADA